MVFAALMHTAVGNAILSGTIGLMANGTKLVGNEVVRSVGKPEAGVVVDSVVDSVANTAQTFTSWFG